MRNVILVPWRTDDAHRARVWEACRRRWTSQFPDWTIYEGRSPEGPFNRSAAINDAARRAGDWDMALIIDADVMLPEANVRKAVNRAAKSGKVTWAHRRWRGINEDSTARILSRDDWAEGALGPGGIEGADFTKADIDLLVEKTTSISWSCCIAVRRDAWETIGGFDERFIGWGFEDSAFSAVAGAFVGWDRIEGDVLNLWHPRSAGNGMAARDSSNRWTPQALRNGRLGMRYMVALRRDYGLADRAFPVDAEVIARDIVNLKREDAGFALRQAPDARREFDDKWPTLDELRDAAREYNELQRRGTVTVVVTSGGTAETWPVRREYLRCSLRSLTANVTGPITQRVLYSDWPEPIHQEADVLAREFGFYAVGGGNNGYTVMRQKLWKYLAKRATGTYIFASEDDFEFTRPVDLGPMLEVMRDEPGLVQLALLREPTYPRERERGGILGWPRASFTEGGSNGTRWLAHRNFFTANPSLIRKSLTDRPWPSGESSERLFGNAIVTDPKAAFAFWGQGEPWIRHLGEVRAGSGY